MNALLRLYPFPDALDGSNATIAVGGQSTHGCSMQELRHDVRAMLQDAMLFNGTLRSNICGPVDDVTDDELWRLLARVSLEDAVRRLPKVCGVRCELTLAQLSTLVL
jgi:ATP-binding cassette subfamily B (MDR/TAP) protein 1